MTIGDTIANSSGRGTPYNILKYYIQQKNKQTTNLMRTVYTQKYILHKIFFVKNTVLYTIKKISMKINFTVNQKKKRNI